MFEKYTEGARRTIFYARHEAAIRGAEAIAPEHLLLGMLRAEPDMIRRLSPEPGEVTGLRNEISAALPPERREVDPKEIALSVEAKDILHEAYEVSEAMRHRHIGVEHLMVGLFSEERRYGVSGGGGIDIRQFLSERGYSRPVIEERILGGATSA